MTLTPDRRALLEQALQEIREAEHHIQNAKEAITRELNGEGATDSDNPLAHSADEALAEASAILMTAMPCIEDEEVAP